MSSSCKKIYITPDILFSDISFSDILFSDISFSDILFSDISFSDIFFSDILRRVDKTVAVQSLFSVKDHDSNFFTNFLSSWT